MGIEIKREVMRETKREKTKRKSRKRDLSESMEDYLEVIKELEDLHKVVRVKHIAERMNVKMPSVSSALSVLERKGYVNYEKYDYVELTESGERIAESLIKRHEALKRFLIDVLQVSETTAEVDACGMEHHVSKQTIDNMLKFIEYIENCAEPKCGCMKNFKEYLKG